MIGGKPTIANVSMATANTEYSYTLPTGANKVMMKLRDPGVDWKFTFVLGGSGTTYVTIPQGAVKTLADVKGTGLVLYFQATSDTQVMEIEIWQ